MNSTIALNLARLIGLFQIGWIGLVINEFQKGSDFVLKTKLVEIVRNWNPGEIYEKLESYTANLDVSFNTEVLTLLSNKIIMEGSKISTIPAVVAEHIKLEAALKASKAAALDSEAALDSVVT